MSYVPRSHGVLVMWCACLPLFGQPSSRELRIAGQYPPAELRFEARKFLAIYRRPISPPGPDDEWVEVRDRQWGAPVVFHPGKGTAPLIPLKLLELEREGRGFPGVADGSAVRATGFSVRSATLSESGRLAICGTAWLDTGRGLPLIVLYEVSTGRLSRAIASWPVSCEAAQVDAGGTLWCLGSDVEAILKQKAPGEVLYRYSPGGRLEWRGIAVEGDANRSGPVLNSANGPARLLLIDEGKLLLCLPARDLLVLADKNGKETWRFSSAANAKGVSYSFAAGQLGLVLSLRPLRSDEAGRMRYGLYRLKGGSAPGSREANSEKTSIQWESIGGGQDFAAHSTEVVGMDGNQPVMWDRSIGRLFWLEPVE